MRLKKTDKVLPPIRPNVGLEMLYRRRLLALVDEMNNSFVYWITAAYRANEPAVLAQDEAPAEALRKAIASLARRWRHRFDQASLDLADYFATAVSKRSDARLKQILKKGGFSVKFTMTPAQRDIIQATVNANVSLICSIPERYLTDVEGMVMRSVQTGRDLGTLAKELRQAYGITRRRAALIAGDQNNKATSAMLHARQAEIGIEKAVWMHSSAGKQPRPTHLKAGRDKVVYDVREGWFDPHEGKYILPGELINCRCTSRPVIPGFTA